MVFIFPSRAGGSWQASHRHWIQLSKVGSTPTASFPLAPLWSHDLRKQTEVLALLPLSSGLPSLPAHFRLFAPVCEVFCWGESVWDSEYQPVAKGLFGIQCFSYVSGAPGVHRKRVSGEYDSRDSGYLPENGPSPQTLRVQAGQDHCQAATTQEDCWR